MALIYLDTNVFIRCFESTEAEAMPLRDLFLAIRDQPGVAITSELTIAELLAPAKRTDALSQHDREELYSWNNFITMRRVSLEILLATARLRRAFNHKLTDAIHVATAEQEGCWLFVSSDRDVRRLPARLRSVPPNAAGVRLCLDAMAQGLAGP